MAEAKIQLTAEDKTRAAFDSVRNSLGGLRANATAVVGTLGALGVAGAAVTFAGMIKGAIDAGDEINKLSQRTGIAAEQLSQLQFAAKLSDVSTDTLTRGIKALNVSIAEGLAGDKEKIALFKSLGITTADLGKGTQSIMLKIADAYSTATDGAGKVAVGNGLMGKSAEEMIPLLNGGSKAILDMMDRANQLGLTISSDFARQSEEFNDNLAIMQSSATGLGIALASDLVGGLSKATKAMAEAYQQGGLLRGVIAGIQTLLTGDDQHKANVAIVDLTDQLLSSQNALDKARGRGDQATVARLTNRVTKLREEIALHQNYAKSLAEVAKAEEAAKPEKTNTIRTPSKAGSSTESPELKEARRVAEARQQLRLAEEKAVADHFFSLRDAEIKAHADSLKAEEKFNEEVMMMGRALTIAQGDEIIRRNEQYQEGLIQAAKKAQDEIDKANEQLSQSLTDALMRGGKNAAQYLKDLFRTLVLRPLLSPIGSAGANAIGSLPGGAAGGSGMLGSLASSGIGQMITAGTGAFSSGLGAGFGALFGEAGITGALSAGATSIGAGSVMAGLGTIAGALGPIALGVGLLASMMDSKGGPKTEGGADLAGTIQQQYNGIAAQLGITNKAIFEAFYSKDPEGDSLTQLRVATLSGGRNIYERLGEENVGRSDAEFSAAVGDATMRAIIAALKDSDLSNEYKQYLDALAADATTADMQRAIDLIGQRKALDEEWLVLTSTDAENLARARQRELDAMDPTLQAIKKRIWAEQDLRRESEATAAMQTRLGDALLDQVRTAESAARDAIARQDAAAVSLRRYLAALTTGPMAALSPEAQYQATRSEFMRLSSLSLDDPERQSKLEEVGTAFLEASRSYNASSMAYFTDLAMVRGAVEASQVAAQTQADIGRMQLTALQSQYGMLSAINGSVIAGNLSVSQAIASLAGALSAAGVNGVRPTTPTGGGAADFYADNPAAAAPDPEGIAFWNAVEQSGAYRDMGYDSAQQWFDAHVAYLNSINGSHASGLDYVPFDGYRAELHRGERVLTASQARGQDMGYMEMVTELRGLRAEVARLTAVSASGMQASLGKQDQIINNTGATAKSALLESTRGVMA